MVAAAPDQAILTETELRARFAPPSRLATLKQLDHLDANCRRFIALSPFFCLATARPGGLADNSPRGDAPGFVQVPDERTLLIPDRPGNNRLDSMANIVANPNVGLLFFIPGVTETLRVNGRARIVTDREILARFEIRDRTAQGGDPGRGRRSLPALLEGVDPLASVAAGRPGRPQGAAHARPDDRRRGRPQHQPRDGRRLRSGDRAQHRGAAVLSRAGPGTASVRPPGAGRR